MDTSLSALNNAAQLQHLIVEALKQSKELNDLSVTFLAENSKDIEFEIKKNLQSQGLVGVVMTPSMEYIGHDGADASFDVKDLTLQIVEYVPINRASNKLSCATGLDIANYVISYLGGPQAAIGFGKLCPKGIEQGEEGGLLVTKATFDCAIDCGYGGEFPEISGFHVFNPYVTEDDISSIISSFNLTAFEKIEELSGDILELGNQVISNDADILNLNIIANKLSTDISNKVNKGDAITWGINSPGNIGVGLENGFVRPLSVFNFEAGRANLFGWSEINGISFTKEFARVGFPGKNAMNAVDWAFKIRYNCDKNTEKGIGTVIKDATISEVKTLLPDRENIYTLGAGGASGDKFSKAKYAILSPLSLPYGEIIYIDLVTPDTVSVEGRKYALLWSHDGSGTYNSSHCTFLGKSTDSKYQIYGGPCQFIFENTILPQNCGLIIQLVPESATPTGSTWDWDSDSGRFEVFAVKCKKGVPNTIINSGGKFFNYELNCEVAIKSGIPAGKILTGENISKSSLVGQTDYFAPVTAKMNTLKVDMAGLSPYVTEAGHFGTVAVCDTSSGYQKANLGQSVIASTKELVILKPNQIGTHPGVVSPSLTTAPNNMISCDTVISGTKATLHAYVPKASSSQAGVVKVTDNGDYLTIEI